MQTIQLITGYLFLIVGVGMEVVSVLVWLGILKPINSLQALNSVSFWDVMLELAKRAPWPSVFGLLVIYAGLKLVGITLPF